MKTHFAFLSFIVFASCAIGAETYVIDPVHSTVGFEVRHFMSKVTGRFNTFGGKIKLDREKPAESVVTVEIDAASIDTGNAKRDAHLRNEDFFNVEKFPQITFTTKSIKVTGDKEGDIVGVLMMHGKKKNVTLKVTMLGEAKGMEGETRASWEATTKIDRKEFGMTWGKLIEGTAVVGDDVEIRLQIEAVKE